MLMTLITKYFQEFINFKVAVAPYLAAVTSIKIKVMASLCNMNLAKKKKKKVKNVRQNIVENKIQKKNKKFFQSHLNDLLLPPPQKKIIFIVHIIT